MRKNLTFIAIASMTTLVACQKTQDLPFNENTIQVENGENVKLVSRGDNTGNFARLNSDQELGKQIFFDLNLSEPGGQACASCHMPNKGFTGLGDAVTGGASQGFIASIAEGAVRGRFGNRKPPSAAYATFSPVLAYNNAGQEFIGGMFWDGRATGLRLGNPTAEQALGPFLNPNEQNHPSKQSVLDKIKASEYASLWVDVYGTPISTNTQAEIDANYDKVGFAISAYEGSPEVNQFSSKYDAYLRGETQLTAQETEGLVLFTNKGECYDCHSATPTATTPPLFTDFTYHNIGVPKNLLNPVYQTNPSFVDLGLGGFLANSPDVSSTWKAKAKKHMGQFKTPTLRNTAKMDRFMHNGVLRSLEEVVHFYNTRDVPQAGWPSPEYIQNVTGHARMGNLGLTPQEEAAIVAFIRTLNDGWSTNR